MHMLGCERACQKLNVQEVRGCQAKEASLGSIHPYTTLLNLITC